jgi:hypothetical protein
MEVEKGSQDLIIAVEGCCHGIVENGKIFISDSLGELDNIYSTILVAEVQFQ